MVQVTADIPESVRLPFLVLRKLGLLSSNVFKGYIPMAILTLSLANLIVIAMVQFINIKRNISDFVKNLENILCFSLILGEVVIVTCRKKDFAKLIETAKLFWNLDKCNEETKAKLNSMYLLIYRLQRVFLLVILTTTAFVVILPFVQKTIPTGIWTMEGQEMLHQFVMVEQILVAPFCGFFLWSLHCMYLGFCAEAVVQFKILSQYLEELRGNGNNVNEIEIDHLSQLKMCISHHNLLLRFVKELQRAFSLILLLEYVIDGPVICAELLATCESLSYQNQIRHGAVFACITIQLSFFCIPANYISSEAVAVSDAVYFSNWYSDYFPSLKVPMLLMIQNSQNGITIKAGGLVTINAETVVNILKVAWSTCSLVRGLRQN